MLLEVLNFVDKGYPDGHLRMGMEVVLFQGQKLDVHIFPQKTPSLFTSVVVEVSISFLFTQKCFGSKSVLIRHLRDSGGVGISSCHKRSVSFFRHGKPRHRRAQQFFIICEMKGRFMTIAQHGRW